MSSTIRKIGQEYLEIIHCAQNVLSCRRCEGCAEWVSLKHRPVLGTFSERFWMRTTTRRTACRKITIGTAVIMEITMAVIVGIARRRTRNEASGSTRSPPPRARITAAPRKPRGDDLPGNFHFIISLRPVHLCLLLRAPPSPPCYAPLREQRARIFNGHFKNASRRLLLPRYDPRSTLCRARDYDTRYFLFPPRSSLRLLGVEWRLINLGPGLPLWLTIRRVYPSIMHDQSCRIKIHEYPLLIQRKKCWLRLAEFLVKY